MTTTLTDYIEARLAETPADDRVGLLRPLAEAVAKADSIDIVFLCTHNSRRSHLAQVWAQTGARHFALEGVQTYSGGIEATAFDPRAVAALRRAGFEIERGEGTDNPVYTLKGAGDVTVECFSKRFDEPPNPQQDFAAVMTCSDADQKCPLVPGASMRFAIPYVDPKVADGTPEEAAIYDERCARIAAEMLWTMKAASQMR